MQKYEEISAMLYQFLSWWLCFVIKSLLIYSVMRTCDPQGGADLPLVFFFPFWSEYVRGKAWVSKSLLYLDDLILNQNRITLKESKLLSAALKKPEQELETSPCSILAGLVLPSGSATHFVISFCIFLVDTYPVPSVSLVPRKLTIYFYGTSECCFSPELFFLFMFSW